MAVEIRLLPGEGMVSQDRDVVSGAPVFVRTRVPISTLFDYLAEGHSLSEYYDDFPGVTPAHTRAKRSRHATRCTAVGRCGRSTAADGGSTERRVDVQDLPHPRRILCVEIACRQRRPGVADSGAAGMRPRRFGEGKARRGRATSRDGRIG